MELLRSNEMIYYSLLTLGFIGVFDEAYFHQYKGNILKRRECFFENTLHLLRSYCFSAIFFIFALFEFSGGYTFILIALFMIDLMVGAFDILVEEKSREFQGGLNRFEYLTHMILSFHLGVLYVNLVPYLYESLLKTPSISFTIPELFVDQVLLLLGLGTFVYSIYQSFILIKVYQGRKLIIVEN